MSEPSIRMRAKEVCQVLACSRDMLYRLNKRGKLRKYNEGRKFAFWLRSEVESYAQGVNPYAGQAEASQGEGRA